MTRVRDIATRSGLVQVLPSSVSVSAGTASVAANGAVSFTSASNIALNDIFSSSFVNYRMMFNGVAAGNVGTSFVYRTSAGDYTTANYTWQRIYAYGSTITSQRVSSQANGLLPDFGADWSAFTADFFNPNVANVYTTCLSQGMYLPSAASPELDHNYIVAANSAQMTGIKFTAATTFTGTVRVYGYNNG